MADGRIGSRRKRKEEEEEEEQLRSPAAPAPQPPQVPDRAPEMPAEVNAGTEQAAEQPVTAATNNQVEGPEGERTGTSVHADTESAGETGREKENGGMGQGVRGQQAAPAAATRAAGANLQPSTGGMNDSSNGKLPAKPVAKAAPPAGARVAQRPATQPKPIPPAQAGASRAPQPQGRPAAAASNFKDKLAKLQRLDGQGKTKDQSSQTRIQSIAENVKELVKKRIGLNTPLEVESRTDVKRVVKVAETNQGEKIVINTDVYVPGRWFKRNQWRTLDQSDDDEHYLKAASNKTTKR